MHRLRHAGLFAALAALPLLAVPSVVLADCMPPPPLAEAVATADIVFVGTVTQTVNNNTWASVTVEEVWKGPDQPAAVVVHGGPGGQMMTSVDRTFQAGTRYLFVPYVDPERGLSDNSCSSTTAWGDEIEGLRPEAVRQPVGAEPTTAGFDPGSLVAPIAIALIVGAVLLGVGLLARGRNPA